MQKSDIWWKCELQPSSAKPSIWSMRVGLASVYGMKVKAELLQVTGAEINIKIAHSNNVAFFFVYGNYIWKFVNNILRHLNSMVCWWHIHLNVKHSFIVIKRSESMWRVCAYWSIDLCHMRATPALPKVLPLNTLGEEQDTVYQL